MKNIGKLFLGIVLFSFMFSIKFEIFYPDISCDFKETKSEIQSDEVFPEQNPEEKETSLYIIELGDDLE